MTERSRADIGALTLMAPSRGDVRQSLHLTLSNHKGAVHVVRYSKGLGQYILSGGQDRTIRLCNPNLGSEIKCFAAHGYEVLCVCISHDNAKFASCGGDRSVFVWDVAAGVTTRRMPGHAGKINVVEFNEDASILASGSYDTTVRLWDLRAQAKAPIQILDDARDAIQTIHIMPSTILTGSVDGHLRTYDLRMGQLRSDFVGAPLASVVPTLDGQTNLVSTLDSTIRLFDAMTGKCLNTFKGHKAEGYRCRAVFDGKEESSVICGDENGKVWAWDIADAKTIGGDAEPEKGHDRVILWTEHHPNQAEMVTASADGTVKVWKPTTNTNA